MGLSFRSTTTTIDWLRTFYLQLVRLASQQPGIVEGTVLPLSEAPPSKYFHRRSNYSTTTECMINPGALARLVLEYQVGAGNTCTEELPEFSPDTNDDSDGEPVPDLV
ncbi:hypothetical protein MVEN_02559600 [Mycena venus]|uniref:Uncharacterized protein n=1 Tax=Mycena venus TaxID=2733690 RepID=A0A8H6WRG4_9AGAR|nr:hypothetical protein MVEN_02559600 [Mycena venus]